MWAGLSTSGAVRVVLVPEISRTSGMPSIRIFAEHLLGVHAQAASVMCSHLEGHIARKGQ
jgi:hypothetical protein